MKIDRVEMRESVVGGKRQDEGIGIVDLHDSTSVFVLIGLLLSTLARTAPLIYRELDNFVIGFDCVFMRETS